MLGGISMGKLNFALAMYTNSRDGFIEEDLSFYLNKLAVNEVSK